MEEKREITVAVTYECNGAEDAINHLALYIHNWLCNSYSADDYKDSAIILNHDTAGCITMVIWPDECKNIPPAWLMDLKMWKYFCSNIVRNYYNAKEDI